MIKHYFWLLPFFCFLTGFFLFHYFFRPPSLPVPALVGKDLYQAAGILSDLSLNLRIIKEQENRDLPQGTILHQTPAAGQKIRVGQSVFLVISHKPETLHVPSFIGKTLAAIEKELANTITLKSYTIAHTYPTGLCFAQIPQPNSSMNPKKIIVYIAAPITKPILWPDFRNKTVQEIQEFLMHYDIKPLYLYKNIPLELEDIPHHAFIKDQRPLPGSLLTLNCQHPLKPQFQIDMTSS